MQRVSASALALLLSATIGLCPAAAAQPRDDAGATVQSVSNSDPPSSEQDSSLTHARSPFWSSGGRLSFGLQAAYGIEVPIARDWSHVNLIYAQPQFSIALHKFRRSRLDRIEFLNEGMLGGAVHPIGRVIGYTPLLRVETRSRGNTKLLFDWGAGVIDAGLGKHVPEVSGDLQFTPQAGIGFEHFFSPQRALVFEYRYLHMSNAGIVQPNFGFQCSVVSVGFRWFRRPRD